MQYYTIKTSFQGGFGATIWLAAGMGAGIMVPIDTKSDEPEIDPMTPEHFDIAVAEINFKRPGMLEACRAVLVDGKRPTEAAEEFEIPQPQISRAVTRVQEKWEQLCARENLVFRVVALSPQAMAVVTELEDQFIAPLKKRAHAKKVRKMAK